MISESSSMKIPVGTRSTPMMTVSQGVNSPTATDATSMTRPKKPKISTNPNVIAPETTNARTTASARLPVSSRTK